jgi:hypothetical protein
MARAATAAGTNALVSAGLLRASWRDSAGGSSPAHLTQSEVECFDGTTPRLAAQR